MEEREKYKANEEPDVEAHAHKHGIADMPSPADEHKDGDDQPDVEAHVHKSKG